MQEIKCPKCGEVFVVDESGYANIVKQVRDKEFARELKKREEELKDAQQKDLDLVRLEQKNQLDKALSAKDSELSEKDKKIQELEACIKNNEISRNLAVSEAVNAKEKEISQKNDEINALKADYIAKNMEQDKEIAKLQAQLANCENEKKMAVSEARQLKDKELADKNTEIIRLKDQLSNKDTEKQLGEESLKREYEAKLKHKDEQLKEKDEQIDYYKDFKARQSTKMVGESLEQHCLTQFNSLRMTAFPTAYFEKDNDAKSGSKGDFIFRESMEGTEFISIMFEMKNEMDETATKHKNEDFFKELDKDRREKKCEYAVLVSLLEMDNELYNNGIVDVSYRYEKMYVIRPQFFIPMITLLRNAALNSLKYRQELEAAKNQQLDIANFEENMNAFKQGFGRNYEIASKKFKTAIDEIDKTITHLQKTKDALLSSENQLRLANNKAEDLSIKKLTKNAPSVRKMFEEI
ncbi:MAG: DUF2130 domain-containing protein [Veillonellaceae bacterium]|nr:DUF2130 domain-containing protein [Veillonellaceae bacterium]